MEENKEKEGDHSIIKNTAEQPLQPQQIENDTKNTNSPPESGAAINGNNPVPPIPAQNVNYTTPILPESKWQKNGASRMAGFMFWTNAAGVILLLIGFVSPGWLTVKTDQNCHLNTYSSYDSGNSVKYKYVYQDYSLWYITQCYNPGAEYACNTMTYRSIDTLYDSRECTKLVIGSLEITETLSLLHFSDAALVFSYSEIVRAQVLYTVGFLIALCTLSKKKWVFLFIKAALSATFVFLPVSMYASIAMQISDGYRSNLKNPVGVVFAGCGGGMMVVCSGAILMHLIFCRNNYGAYLCSTEEYEVQVPEEEEEV